MVAPSTTLIVQEQRNDDVIPYNPHSIRSVHFFSSSLSPEFLRNMEVAFLAKIYNPLFEEKEHREHYESPFFIR